MADATPVLRETPVDRVVALLATVESVKDVVPPALVDMEPITDVTGVATVLLSTAVDPAEGVIP